MNKRITFLVSSLVVVSSLAGCKDKNPCANGHNYVDGTCTVCGDKDPNYNPKREVKTYVDYSFDELEVGDLLDLEHDENGYFEYYEGSFTASSKDDDGNVWIQTTATDGWGLCYTNIYDRNVKKNLKDFCVSFDTRLPHIDGQLDVAADGGVCILWNPQAGRYDLAMHYDGVDQGAGVGNSFNLWHAMNTDGGPFASTQNNEDWGDRGSLIDEFSLSEGITYTITCCGKHQGIDSDGNEFFTFYLFVNDKLVCYKRDVVYWDGGFGLRGYISAYEYANFKVSDFPTVCPDGIDHYTLDNVSTTYSKVATTKLATPVATIAGTTISWDAVEGADYYNIVRDGTRVGWTRETSFDFSEIFGSGIFQVIASPKDFGVNASDACEVAFSHEASKIATPVLQFEEATGRVSWLPVEHAEAYEIYVDGELVTTQTGLFYRPVVLIPGTYEVQVKAITSINGYASSDLSSVCNLIIAGLDAPVITLTDKTVTWDAVAGADKYLVYVNDNEPVEVTECTYTTTEEEFRISVVAVDSTGCKLDSVKSNEVSSGDVVTLATPVLKVQGTTLSWTEVAQATKYAIYKNGEFLQYVNGLSYTISELAVYSVKAVGNGKMIKDSELSKEYTHIGLTGADVPYFSDNTASQEVGQVADYGWNVYNANYVIKEKADGITWMGTNDPELFHETWFWAKTDENDNTKLTDWTYESYVKMMPTSADDCVQLMFGTAATGGRYSCFFYFANGGSIEHSSMQLYKEGAGIVATSWETDNGGTGALGSTVELVKGEAAKITINHVKLANGKGRITVFVNNVLVIDKSDLVLAVGDFGLWLNAGVDAWFGNPKVTTLKQPEDCTFVGAPIILEAPVVYLDDETLSWEEIPYAYGYGVYLNGVLVANLKNNVTTYTMEEEGNYTVRALGNGVSVISSVDSLAPIENVRAPLSTGLNYANQAVGEIADFSGWNSSLVIKEAKDANGITWLGHPEEQSGSDYNSAWFWAHDLQYNGETDYLNNYTYSCYIKPLSTDESSEGKVQLYIGTVTHKYCIALCTKTGFVQIWDNVENRFVTDAASATFNVDEANLVQIKHKVINETSAQLDVVVNGTKVLSFNSAIAKGDFGMDIFGNTDVLFGNPNVTTTDIIEETPACTNLNYGHEAIGELVDFGGWNSQLVVKQTNETDGVTWFGAVKDGNNTYNQAWFNASVLAGEDDYCVLNNYTYSCHIKPLSTDESSEGKVQLYIGTATHKYCIALCTKTGSIQIWDNVLGRFVTDAYAANFGVDSDNLVQIKHQVTGEDSALISIYLNGDLILEYNSAIAKGDFGMDIFSGTDVWFGSPSITTTDRY